MKTRDPFLTMFAVWFDRLVVWLTLVAVSFAVLWSAICGRALGLPWSEATRQLTDVAAGRAVPIITVLAALTLAVAALGTSVVAAWLFARWRRQGRLQAAHLRGSRLED